MAKRNHLTELLFSLVCTLHIGKAVVLLSAKSEQYLTTKADQLKQTISLMGEDSLKKW